MGVVLNRFFKGLGLGAWGLGLGAWGVWRVCIDW